MKTQGYIGIDVGTQGLSVIFTDDSLVIRGSGDVPYEMVPGLEAGSYEQQPGDWEQALRAAMRDLRAKLSGLGIEMEVRAIGISGQMHGEVLCDASGEPLAAARLWCDARNEAEGLELTERMGVKCPKRMTASRWLWTIRNRPDLARQVAHITTPGGWIAFRLTGAWTLGIGDASGMFPIQQTTLDYDAKRLADFDALTAQAAPSLRLPPLAELLPTVRRAGEDAGSLHASGAALLGLPQGTPLAPAEGDQPAALAGSLIGTAGMVSMSFGTSVVANSVGDRPFQGVDKGVDHFCAVDGKPINMIWLRNGTTAMNAIVEMIGGALPAGSDPFSVVMPLVLAAPDDCGGLVALPCLDDEPGLGVSRGGSASVVGFTEHNATPGNAAKAMLLATIFNLKLGSDVLESQGYPRHEIVLSGGLVKTPALGQLVADVFRTPVVILDCASEGSGWGGALLAAYRDQRIGGYAGTWEAFLAGRVPPAAHRFTPRTTSAVVFDRSVVRHRRLLALHHQLEQAVT
jgi:sugar (pentulose or hexulose) kinase